MPRRRTIIAAALAGFGAAAATYLAVKRAGEQRRAEPAQGPIGSTSRAARNIELAKVGIGAGGSLAAHRTRRAFAGASRREALDARFELKTAEQVVAALGNMKGALMKLGQMAS